MTKYDSNEILFLIDVIDFLSDVIWLIGCTGCCGFAAMREEGCVTLFVGCILCFSFDSISRTNVVWTLFS